MSGVRQVLLARHGQTALNAEGRLRGLSNPPLDEVGAAQAARLGKALAVYHPTAVLSSPLRRAMSTAEAIAGAAGLTVTVDHRLNDRDYGPWTGHPKSEVEARFGSVDAAPGVEPATAVAARARSAFFELIAEHRVGPLVMVSHDAFNQALLAELDPSLGVVHQATACWNRLAIVDGFWRVQEVDQRP